MQIITLPHEIGCNKMLSEGIRFNYSPKAIIYLQNESAEKAFYLEEGLVKLTIANKDGAQKTLNFIEKGKFFGAIGVLLKSHCYGSTAMAVTRLQVVCFSKVQFLKLISENTDFVKFYALSLAKSCWTMGKQINSLFLQDRFGKVAGSLLYLGKYLGEPVNGQGGEENAISLRITHQELAEFSGMNRVTVTNVLDEFETNSLIQKRPKEIIILDFKRLRGLLQ